MPPSSSSLASAFPSSLLPFRVLASLKNCAAGMDYKGARKAYTSRQLKLLAKEVGQEEMERETETARAEGESQPMSRGDKNPGVIWANGAGDV
jgi:hypothetical protein